MLAAERHDRIVNVVQARQYVRSEELAERLSVSLETIRRDLVTLERQGKLRRVRGGASQHQSVSSEEAIYAERSKLAAEEKSGMAQTAASLITPGMTLMIDIGTSCLNVARAIPVDFRGRIVTCSLPVAIELADRADVEILVSGGRLRPDDLALSNGQTVSFFQELRPDLAFLGSGGLDADAGLTDYYTDEVATRRVVLHNAAQSYVLADSTKHGHIAPFKVCDLSGFTGLITDRVLDQALSAALRRAGAEVLTNDG